MDANQAFEAIKKIAQSSCDPADVKAMRARAREVIDQFKAGKAARAGGTKALSRNLRLGLRGWTDEHYGDGNFERGAAASGG